MKLFGSVFFIAGLGVLLFFVIKPLGDWAIMQSWVSTEAILQSAKVDSFISTDSEGRSSTQYQSLIQYSYQVNGQSYTGTRGRINDMSSSDREPHAELVNTIRRVYDRRQLYVWYDPDKPSNSIYQRTFYFSNLIFMAIFSLIFMMAGFGIANYSRFFGKQLTVNPAAIRGEPWSNFVEWTSPEVYSDIENRRKIWWFIAIFCSLFFGVFAFMAISSGHWVAIAVGLLLTGPPLFLIRKAFLIGQDWRKHGKVPLQLLSVPGVIGGQIRGEIVLPWQPTGRETVRIGLSCKHRYTSSSGGKNRSHVVEVFEMHEEYRPIAKSGGAFVAFNLNIPAGQPETSEPGNNYHEWSAIVECEEKGFRRSYSVPVFVTPESLTVAAELEETPLTRDEITAISERVELQSDGSALSFSTPRSTIGMIIFLIGDAFFTVGLAIAIFAEAVFGYFFAGVSLLFVALGFWAWGRSCNIEVRRDCLTAEIFLFGKKINEHQFTPAEIDHFRVHQVSSTSQGGKQTSAQFNIKLHPRSGTPVDLGGEYKSERNAEHVKQQIEELLGMT